MRHKILIIEDNPDQSVMLQTALQHHGYAVVSAPGAQQGLLFAEMHRPGLILLDIGLVGHMDGWEVLQKLKATPETAIIPVMIVSAQGNEDSIQQAQIAGAADYLKKPYEVSELILRVQHILASRSLPSQ